MSNSAPLQQRDRILIVEDEKDSADTLAELLRLEGYEIRICYDGHSAMSEVQRWRPTAAIVDIGLPGLTVRDRSAHTRAALWQRSVVDRADRIRLSLRH